METKGNKVEYPMRINRYMYVKNISSRREADRLIEKGLIKINGKRAVLGQKVQEGDSVELVGKAKNIKKNYVYYAFNKPKNMISHSPQDGEESADECIDVPEKVSVVGRLDKDSHGLMILTNDGRIVDKMLNPKYEHDKEYVVKVDKELKKTFKAKMEGGVNIERYITKPAKVKVLSEKTFKITLTEGKKHQIRRMTMALGYTVKDLKRKRIMNIELKNLRKGEWRKIDGDELKELLNSLNV